MNVPKLRFKEFDGEWEEFLSSDIFCAISDKGYPDLPVLSASQELGMIKRDEIGINIKYNKEGKKQYKRVKPGQFVIHLRSFQGGFAWSEIEGITSPAYTVLDYKEPSKQVPDFWKQIFTSSYFIKRLNTITYGIRDGRSISFSDFKTLKFKIPQREEQNKISLFLGMIDKKIQLQQQKIDLLQEQKKGFLQKMFPKVGETQPEMRFDGFTGEWEECKLREVANHRGGTAIEKYFDDNGDYKVISIGSYGLDNKYVDQNIRAISNDITDSRLVKKGELTMVLNDKTSNGTIIGRSLLIEKDNEFVVNQRTEIISPKTAFDSAFAYVTLNGPFREKVRKIVQGGTQIYVNYSAVENLNLLVPQIEEQKKIGSFFKQLDNVITFQQQKLELFQKQKQGFMQQMFI